ncbi:MAG: DUF2341 domain-containing protein [Nannocystales bacterium]
MDAKLPADVSDFTALVRLDDAASLDLADDGSDLRFVDAESGELLPHEVESWSPEGTSTLWVRLPQLRDTTAVHVYGGAGQVDSAEDAAATWPASHVAVWHMDGSEDSTSFGHELSVNGPTDTQGIVGTAFAFDGASDNINAGSPQNLQNLFADSATVMAWVRLDAFPESFGRVISKSQTDVGHAGWYFGTAASTGDGQPERTLVFYRGLGDGFSGRWAAPTDSVTAGEWAFIAVALDYTKDGVPQFHVDGEPRFGTSVNGGFSGVNDAPYPLLFGNSPTGGQTVDGDIDEVRILNVALSTERIALEHLSMRDGLWNIGPLQESPCP